LPREWAPSKRGRRGKARSFGKIKDEASAEVDAEVISLDGSDADDDVISIDGGSSDSGKTHLRRINVDKIEATYNDEEDELWKLFAPVRVKRVKHLDRAPQISSSVGADLKDERGGSFKDTGTQDVEIVRTVRKYRGVYQEDDDQPPARTSYKTTSRTPRPARQPPQPKRKQNPSTEPPALWTDDDKSEWARRRAADNALVEELSQVRLGAAAEQEHDADDEHADRRRDRVYIYTFPPLLPPLVDAAKPAAPVKAERPGSPVASRAPEAAAAASAGGTRDEPVVIKDDPAEGTSTAAGRKKGGFPDRPRHLPALEPGRVGRLVVRRSGRATLDWGGASLRVGLGLTPDVLQDVVSVSGLGGGGDGARPAADAGGFAGRACSFGQVRGKFVVTPDWDELLGAPEG
jgi:hypothetical protein